MSQNSTSQHSISDHTIIDSHHHIWRQSDLPWLQGPEQPRIFGPYSPIKRDYLIEEYKEDIATSGINKSVYVQANWAVDKAADEAAWVQSVADETGWPHGIVAYADFTVDDVRPQLDVLKKYKLVRGIRQQLHWHKNPLYCFANNADMGSDENFQQNVSTLSDYGWCFDLQVFAGQCDSAVDLVRACPDVNFILQHAGMLEDTTEQGWADWLIYLHNLASYDNVHVKLSGLGTFVHRVDAALINRTVFETVRVFGAQRCMFGSNFPIEKLWTNYEDLVVAMKQATNKLSDNENKSIFNDTAERLYQL